MVGRSRLRWSVLAGKAKDWIDLKKSRVSICSDRLVVDVRKGKKWNANGMC